LRHKRFRLTASFFLCRRVQRDASQLWRRSRTRRSRISDRVADSVIPSSRSMKTGSRQSFKTRHACLCSSTRPRPLQDEALRATTSSGVMTRVLVVSHDTETLGSSSMCAVTRAERPSLCCLAPLDRLGSQRLHVEPRTLPVRSVRFVGCGSIICRIEVDRFDLASRSRRDQLLAGSELSQTPSPRTLALSFSVV
jgi:hypothetical protein